MRRRLPPDRDPLLREAFSLNAAAQIALLHTLTGEADTSRAPREPVCAQRPLVGRFIPTEAGGVIYEPPQLSGDLNVKADNPTIPVLLEHVDLERRRQFCSATNIWARRFQEVLTDVGPMQGIHTIANAVPVHAWTPQHLHGLARRLSEFVPTQAMRRYRSGDPRPETDRLADDDGVLGYWTIVPKPTQYHYALLCSRFSRSFTAWIRVWKDDVNPECRAWFEQHTRFTPLDAASTHTHARQETPDTHAEDTDATEPDDLDPIEKACRRRLHGDRGIPPSSGAQPAAAVDAIAPNNYHTIALQLLDLTSLARTHRDVFDIMHEYAVRILKGGHS